VDEMTEETYPVTPVEVIEWVVRADPDEPPPETESPGLDVERLVRAMERAMAAVDDEWTIPEFAEITAAEYARLAPPPVIEGPINDANGDELEHGEPDYPGQFEETK
jgi:hypothetical protein